jgi:hypothetical protein
MEGMLFSAVNDGERTVLNSEIRITSGTDTEVQIASVGVPVEK